MSFPLVHFRSRLYLYKSGNKILDLSSNYIGGTSSSTPVKDCLMEVDYQFQNTSTPSTTTITLHNLTKRDTSKFKKGEIISVWAGWSNSNWTQDNVSHIFTSTISTINPVIDSAGDWQLSITCQDGDKFSGETALSKLYKSESRSVRNGASDTLGRSAIGSINKLFKGKRNKLTEYCHGKDVSIRKARKLATETFAKERKNIEKRRHADVKKFESEDKALKGKKTGYAKTERQAIKKARNAARATLSSEDHNIKNHEKDARNIFSGKSKQVTHYRRHRSRSLRKQENHKKTVARGKRERARRAKSRQKSKSKKTRTTGLHFKKNTMAKTIINKLAKLGHIKISHMKLVKNHRFTSGYTATKTPWQEIQTVARDYCNSNIWWPHGALYIGNFAKHKRMNFTLTPDTGLIQTPEPQDDDSTDTDDDSSTETKKQKKKDAIANPITYSVSSIFLPQVTTGSTFRIIDPSKSLNTNAEGNEPIPVGSLFNNEIIVQSGEMTFGQDDTPSCSLNVITTSAQAAKDKMKDDQQSRKAKEKADKDHKKRRRVKAVRARRSHARRRK